MIFGSVCSGIEAASVAWHPLGWRAAFLSEIEAFPRAVLAHHYPDVPLHGDFTTIEAGQYAAIDVLVGGTPCQSFSVAGLRGGLGDDRGNLALEYLRLADRLRPKWLVWENVPGVLSSSGGRDFGSILGGLGELGYGWAYRVLDAQHVRVDGFGRAVPQRRRRVFVVGHLGDWRRAAAVLFERESLCGNPSPRREAGKEIAGAIAASLGGSDENDAAETVSSKWAKGRGGYAGQNETENCCVVPATEVAHCLGAAPAAHTSHGEGQTNYAVVAEALQAKDGRGVHSQMGTFVAHAVAGLRVRRLTPTECERLQGFPDGYTAVPYRGKPAADGPRYKALGNSMAVNVMRWIGRRINLVESVTKAEGLAA